MLKSCSYISLIWYTAKKLSNSFCIPFWANCFTYLLVKFCPIFNQSLSNFDQLFYVFNLDPKVGQFLTNIICSVDTTFWYERELIVCSFLQDFCNVKGSNLQLICYAHTVFLLCGAEIPRWCKVVQPWKHNLKKSRGEGSMCLLRKV